MAGRTSWTCGFVAHCHIVIGYIAPGDRPVLSMIRPTPWEKEITGYEWTEREDSGGDWHPEITVINTITGIIQYQCDFITSLYCWWLNLGQPVKKYSASQKYISAVSNPAKSSNLVYCTLHPLKVFFATFKASARKIIRTRWGISIDIFVFI